MTERRCKHEQQRVVWHFHVSAGVITSMHVRFFPPFFKIATNTRNHTHTHAYGRARVGLTVRRQWRDDHGDGQQHLPGPQTTVTTRHADGSLLCDTRTLTYAHTHTRRCKSCDPGPRF